MRIRYLVFLSLSALIPALIQAKSQAQEFCFSLAENYYEQLYCEIKAKGVSKGLPSLYVFKTNEPLTQALLLKRPAARIGIEVTLPKKAPRHKVAPASTKPSKPTKPDKIKPAQKSSQSKAAQSGSKTIKSKKAAPVLENIISIDGSHPLALCALSHNVVECKSGKFHLTGNKRNKNLHEGVLLSDNKLAIESYQPKKHKDELLNKYLEDAYRLYIEKMFEIGLGAATLSYSKFVFLFNDMEANNVDFSGRFETMFRFLKKDKLSISVSEKVPGNVSVSMENCMLINANIIVCESGRKNYLYVKNPESKNPTDTDEINKS